MSLFPCAECKAEISTEAAACPRCGAPVRLLVPVHRPDNSAAVGAARVGALLIVASMGACVSGYGEAGVGLLVIGFVLAIGGWLGGGAR